MFFLDLEWFNVMWFSDSRTHNCQSDIRSKPDNACDNCQAWKFVCEKDKWLFGFTSSWFFSSFSFFFFVQLFVCLFIFLWFCFRFNTKNQGVRRRKKREQISTQMKNAVKCFYLVIISNVLGPNSCTF